MANLAREWGVEMHMVKLDLRRAFDSVYRVKLAERVQAWCLPQFPGETRCLIRLLAAADLALALPWGCHDIHSNTGVKQGATESPLLFGRLIDEILGDIPCMPGSLVFPDLEEDGGCFMDDIVGWHRSLETLQLFLNALLPRLREFGLFIQPPKCKLLSTHHVAEAHLVLEGHALLPMPKGDPMMIMNLPVGFENTEKHVLEHLIERARSKFFGILHILTSSAPLVGRLRVLRTVVFGSIRWVVGILFPTKQLQAMLNQFECMCVRKMMGIKRGRNELWVDFEQRSLRAARGAIHRHVGLRWGDEFIKAYWTYTGHRVREGVKENASVAGKLSMYRSLGWWRGEQQSSVGSRHPRHFPKLMNEERPISTVIGSENWRVVAANRQHWSTFLPRWVEYMSIPWSSGRQPALEN